MKAVFVVFEGLDGSGTSTQAGLLEAALRKKNIACSLTAEPSSGPVGQMIRQALKGRLKFAEQPAHFDRQLAYLFAADRYDHLYNGVDGVLALQQREISIICTRYVGSSFAYHCSCEEDWQRIRELNKEFPIPDLLVYLRNPVSVSVRRMENRSTLDSYESPDKLDYAAKNYERFLQEYNGRSVAIDATLQPAAIHELVLREVANLN